MKTLVAALLAAASLGQAPEGWTYADGGRTATRMQDGVASIRIACTRQGDLGVEVPGAGKSGSVALIRKHLRLVMRGTQTADGSLLSSVPFQSLTAEVIREGGIVELRVDESSREMSLDGAGEAVAAVQRSCQSLS